MNAEPELPELTPEMIQSGCRLCTEEDMQKMPKLFERLGICDAEGKLLVSPDPETGSCDD